MLNYDLFFKILFFYWWFAESSTVNHLLFRWLAKPQHMLVEL